MNASEREYLRTVYFLAADSGATRVSDIAKALCVSKPSVSNAIGKLLGKDFVQHERYGDIRLTKKGSKAAQALVQSYERLKKRMSGSGERV